MRAPYLDGGRENPWENISNEMAKENIIDSWKWVTDFEPTFGLDFGEEL